MSAFGVQLLPTPAGPVPLWRRMLRGLGQCGFQANELTGVVLVIAVAVFSPVLAAMFATAVVVGTLTAQWTGGRRDMLDSGVYGFNPGLMGLALGSFFVESAAVWVAVLVVPAFVAAFAVLLSRVLPFPALAAPFILTFWALYAVADTVGLRKVPSAMFVDVEVDYVGAVFAALGSMLFAGGVLSGVLVLVAIALSDWRHAVVAVVGVMAAHVIADHWDIAGGEINAGLVGFNAVICSLAVYTMVAEDLRLTLFGAIGATMLIRVFASLGLVPLAAGFVTMTWLLMFLTWLNPRFNAGPRPAPA